MKVTKQMLTDDGALLMLCENEGEVVCIKVDMASAVEGRQAFIHVGTPDANGNYNPHDIVEIPLPNLLPQLTADAEVYEAVAECVEARNNGELH